MTMRTANRYMTPCEVLRQINDLCQDDTDKDKIIRELLSKFEKMAKKLSREINNRKGKKLSDDWWEKNTIDFENISKWRMSDDYKYEK